MANNRCPDCGRFVSLDLGQPEVEIGDLDEGDGTTGTLNVMVKLSKTCADCGREMATKEIETVVQVDLTGFEDAE